MATLFSPLFFDGADKTPLIGGWRFIKDVRDGLKGGYLGLSILDYLIRDTYDG
jgi:hypothetical protein